MEIIEGDMGNVSKELDSFFLSFCDVIFNQ